MPRRGCSQPAALVLAKLLDYLFYSGAVHCVCTGVRPDPSDRWVAPPQTSRRAPHSRRTISEIIPRSLCYRCSRAEVAAAPGMVRHLDIPRPAPAEQASRTHLLVNLAAVVVTRPGAWKRSDGTVTVQCISPPAGPLAHRGLAPSTHHPCPSHNTELQ